MFETIIETLADYTSVAPEEMTRDTRLIADLDMSSLDVVDVVLAFEETYEISIPDEDLRDLRTIGDIADYLESRV